MADVRLNTDALDKLLQSLLSTSSVKVGILNKSPQRTDDIGNNNASIGAIHEFGTAKLPQRSFLRMPIAMFLDKKLKETNLFTENSLREIIKTGSITPILTKIGIVAEVVVLEAFETGGYGQWKPSDMSKKKVHQTLVETQQLRNSITSEVEE